MVDSLKLSSDDFKVRPGASLTIQPATVDYSSGETKGEHLLWEGDGSEVRGSKAYLNTDCINATIAPGRQEGSSSLLYVQCSLPKVARGSNFAPISEAEARDGIKGIERMLRDAGVRFNVDQARLSRLDLFKNAYTDEPFSTYHDLLSRLGTKRMQKRDYGTSFLLSNTRAEVSVYDKIVEMEHRKESIEGLPRTIRFESRLLTHRKIREFTGMETTSDLLGEYGALGEHFQRAMRDNLFRWNPDELAVVLQSELEAELRYFKAMAGRNWHSKYLSMKGAESILQGVSPEIYRDALANVIGDRDRKKLYRAQRVLEDAERDLAFIRERKGEGKTRGQLYRELAGKLEIHLN